MYQVVKILHDIVCSVFSGFVKMFIFVVIISIFVVTLCYTNKFRSSKMDGLQVILWPFQLYMYFRYSSLTEGS